MSANDNEIGQDQERGFLVERGLKQLKDNIKTLKPAIIKRFEEYLSKERYRNDVVITHDKSDVKVDLAVWYVDTNETAIYLVPVVRPIDPKEPTKSFQHTRINFDKIELTEEEQIQCSTHVWQELNDDHKLAFCFRETGRMMSEDNRMLESLSGLIKKGKIDEATAERFRKDANERIAVCLRIEKSLREGKAQMSLHPGDASILIKA